MGTLLYFVGFILAIFIAIYFIDIYHTVQEKAQGLPLNRDSKRENSGIKAAKSEVKPIYRFPRTKICPLCQAQLEQHDVLVATMFDEKTESGKQRVIIHGCKYCNRQAAAAKSADSQAVVKL